MNIAQQIKTVYQRALLLRQQVLESPVQQELLEKSLQELYFVLEELQTSQEELHKTNETLLATRQLVELERQRYQALFELAPNGYLVTDRQGNIVQANHYASASLFCAPQEYLINKPLLVFVHEPDRPYFQAQLTQLPSGHPWEVTLNPRDGALVTVQVSVTQIQDPQHNQEMLLWSLHDITFRKQVAQQLQLAHDELEQRISERTAELTQANERLQQEINERQQAEQKIRYQAALIDVATDAIFVQDFQHHIIFWSKGAERLYGWTSAEVLGQSVKILFPQEETSQLTQAFIQAIQHNSWQAELDQVTRTQTGIIVASRWDVMRDETGQPQSILVVNTDITEKKKLEAQFYHAQRIESLGMLASGVAHDLNNILTPISTLAQLQLLQQQTLDKQTLKIWQVVQDAAKRGTNLVQQITLFARGTSGEQIALQPESLLVDTAKILEQTFPETIQIDTQIPEQPFKSVLGDPTQLCQVVMNLCVNARDAMPQGGTLTLAIEQQQVDAAKAHQHLEVSPGEYVVLKISDTGIGIPTALVEHIFEPFFTTKAPGQGTGLGLSTVFSIVKNHRGFVELSSQEGIGTEFQVYLPALNQGKTQPVDAEADRVSINQPHPPLSQ